MPMMHAYTDFVYKMCNSSSYYWNFTFLDKNWEMLNYINEAYDALIYIHSHISVIYKPVKKKKHKPGSWKLSLNMWDECLRSEIL